MALAPISYKNSFRARKNKMWGNAAIFIVHVMLRIFFVHVHASGQNNSNSLFKKQTPGNETTKVAIVTIMWTNYINSSFW